MEVLASGSGIMPVLQLSNKAVEVEFLAEHSVKLRGIGEELSHDEQVLVLGSGGLQQVLADMDWRRMSIVQSEAVGH